MKSYETAMTDRVLVALEAIATTQEKLQANDGTLAVMLIELTKRVERIEKLLGTMNGV